MWSGKAETVGGMKYLQKKKKKWGNRLIPFSVLFLKLTLSSLVTGAQTPSFYKWSMREIEKKPQDGLTRAEVLSGAVTLNLVFGEMLLL